MTYRAPHPQAEIIEDFVLNSGFTWQPEIVKTLDYEKIKRANPLEDTHLYILCGVSTAGKDTLLKKALEKVKNITFVPRATSRAPRLGEIDGIHYYFSLDECILWSTYADNVYAVPTKLFSILSEKKKVVTSQGLVYAPTLKEMFERLGAKVTILYVLPGNITDSLEKLKHTVSLRLTIRDEKDQRLTSATNELQKVMEYKEYLKKIGIIFIENIPNSLGYAPMAVAKLTSILSKNVA